MVMWLVVGAMAFKTGQYIVQQSPAHREEGGGAQYRTGKGLRYGETEGKPGHEGGHAGNDQYHEERQYRIAAFGAKLHLGDARGGWDISHTGPAMLSKTSILQHTKPAGALTIVNIRCEWTC